MRTMKQIADKAQQVYHELYSIEDTIKGNSLEMHEEARKLSIKLFDMIDSINQIWGGEIDNTCHPEDKEEAWNDMQEETEAYSIEETIRAYMYWTDCTEEEARNELRRE